MRIAVNARMLIPGKLDGIGWFSHEVLSRLVKLCPNDEFLFLFDRAFDPQFVYADNVEPRVLFPPARHPLLYQWYFERSVPTALKRWQPDLFFSPDGFLSTKTRVSQVPVIHDLNFEHRPQDLPASYSRYYRNYFPRFARLARNIITVSNYSADDIAKTYGVDREKITVAYNAASDAYRPLSEAEKEEARQEFAGGRPYFIFVGNFSYRKNIHGIIRAYRAYRERGGTSALVLVGNPLWSYKEMKQELDGFKQKNDIFFPGRLPQNRLIRAVGGGQSLLFLSYFEGFGIPIAEAFKACLPVINSNVTSLPEIAGKATLSANPENTSEIVEHMFRIESDKQLRQALIEKGTEQLKNFNWDMTANKIKVALY